MSWGLRLRWVAVRMTEVRMCWGGGSPLTKCRGAQFFPCQREASTPKEIGKS